MKNMKTNISKILIGLIVLVFSLVISSETQAYVSYDGRDWRNTSNSYQYNEDDEDIGEANYVSIFPYQRAPVVNGSLYENGSSAYPTNSNQNSNNGYVQYGTSTGAQTAPPVINNYYYQNTTPKTTTSTSTVTKNTTNTNNKVDTTSKTDSSTNSNSEVDMNNLPSVSKLNSVDKSNLPALTLNGEGTFMPSSIWQWILVIILILAIIVIARVLSHKKKNSHLSPHAIPAH